jgi:hypothetical protein
MRNVGHYMLKGRWSVIRSDGDTLRDWVVGPDARISNKLFEQVDHGARDLPSIEHTSPERCDRALHLSLSRLVL